MSPACFPPRLASLLAFLLNLSTHSRLPAFLQRLALALPCPSRIPCRLLRPLPSPRHPSATAPRPPVIPASAEPAPSLPKSGDPGPRSVQVQRATTSSPRRRGPSGNHTSGPTVPPRLHLRPRLAITPIRLPPRPPLHAKLPTRSNPPPIAPAITYRTHFTNESLTGPAPPSLGHLTTHRAAAPTDRAVGPEVAKDVLDMAATPGGRPPPAAGDMRSPGSAPAPEGRPAPARPGAGAPPPGGAARGYPAARPPGTPARRPRRDAHLALRRADLRELDQQLPAALPADPNRHSRSAWLPSTPGTGPAPTTRRPAPTQPLRLPVVLTLPTNHWQAPHPHSSSPRPTPRITDARLRSPANHCQSPPAVPPTAAPPYRRAPHTAAASPRRPLPAKTLTCTTSFCTLYE